MRLTVLEEFSRFYILTRAKIPIFGGSLSAKPLAQLKGKYSRTKQNKTKPHQKDTTELGKIFAGILCKPVRRIIY